MSNGNGTVLVPLNGSKMEKLSAPQSWIKADHDIRIPDINRSEAQFKKDISEECGELAYDYISKNINLLDPGNHVFATTTRFDIMQQPENQLNGIINLKKVNDIPDINKFFEAVNTKLSEKGRFILCAETKDQRKKRLLKKYPVVLNWIFYFFDYIFKRVLPRINLTKKIHFFLTRGANKVLTRTEILGRLYSCGFIIENETIVNGRCFFSVRKNGSVLFPKNSTDGIIVKLPRIGKGGKIISVYKMRTMHPYSEYLQDYVYRENKLKNGGKFANDFRISSTGRIIRELWIDELPMLLNWIRGDLKLVGVRPLSEHYFSLYTKKHQVRRNRYKPGLVPPYYADLPETLKEIEASEKRFLDAYDKQPFRTNWHYFWKIWYNIIFKKARSK